ncbi:MAG: efflux RND transporter periplasmic adaptor subunit [Candidatus Eisenbacteria bacterium]
MALSSGCGKDHEGGAQAGNRPQGPGAGHPQGPGGGPPTPAVAVAVEQPLKGPIQTYYRTTASLDASNEAAVTARVSGVVTALQCEEGDQVGKDQVLLRIDPTAYDLRLKQAEAEAVKQKTQFDRTQKMFEQTLVAAQEFDAARNDYQSAEAAAELARLELSYTRVQAPIRGVIVSRMVDVGRTVNPGDALFRIADLHPLLARVHVPAKEFRSLETNQRVHLQLDSNGEKLDGRISLVSPIVDPNTGTIKITIEIDDYPTGTRPGDFAAVSIVTERREDVLLVPKLAVVTEKGERVVYVAADSVAQRRTVEVGFEDEEHAEIMRGLEYGESVVVQGQRSLKDGAPIKILDPMRFEDSEGTDAAS